MKLWEMILPVYQITGAEGRVKPLFLLGLRASPSHNVTNIDWESKFLPGLGMVNVSAITTSLTPWRFHRVGFSLTPPAALFPCQEMCMRCRFGTEGKANDSPPWGKLFAGLLWQRYATESTLIEAPTLNVFGQVVRNIFNITCSPSTVFREFLLSLFNKSKVDTRRWILHILMSIMSMDCSQTSKHWRNFRVF